MVSKAIRTSHSRINRPLRVKSLGFVCSPHFSLSPPRLAFLAWGDFHARSRFLSEIVKGEKNPIPIINNKGTARSLLRATLADQGPSSTVAFFRITFNIIILKVGTCNFTITERNIKAIFRRYFSSLRFDSGKIFTIILADRGQHTIYKFIRDRLCSVRNHHACFVK